MKVVIADDEAHVRRGIELSVDWKRFGVTERLMANDGAQAIELIRKHRPAILFCDMRMPNMDGSTLLRCLRSEGWKTQVIVVSGYDDYEYTRATLRAGGVDYILKPFNTKELDGAVSRAVAAYRAANAQMKDEAERRDRILRDDSLVARQSLAGYLTAEVALTEERLRALLERQGLSWDALYVSCILPRNTGGVLYGEFHGDLSLFRFAVECVARETCASFCSYCLVWIDDYQWTMIASPMRADGAAAQFERTMVKLARAWRRALGIEILHGTQEVDRDDNSNPHRLQDAAAAARRSLLQRELSDGSRSERSARLPRLEDSEIVLMNAVRERDKNSIQAIIRAFVDELRTRGAIRLEELQTCTMEANVLLRRIASTRPAERESIHRLLSPWIGDLDEWAVLVSQRFWELAEESAVDYSVVDGMEAVSIYIRQHLTERITLPSLSAAFHSSPRYFAKKFKNRYGVPIMTYVTDARIERAKTLLAHSNIPVFELSRMVGYEDENYFSKVFKKSTGSTPTQFRKRNNAQ